MQTENLSEIDDNDLARATITILERIRPHLRTIAMAVGLVFAGLAAWTLVSSQRDAEKMQAWDACLAAFSARDGAQLGQVTSRYPGSAAAVWSQILLADGSLAEGTELMFVDRARARERLDAAAGIYAGVMSQRPAEVAAERAIFGLAKAREALGDLAAAKQGYETLVAEHPRSPLRGLAESRLAALGRPAVPEWYHWFESHDAKAPATPESPAAGEPAAGTPAEPAGAAK